MVKQQNVEKKNPSPTMLCPFEVVRYAPDPFNDFQGIYLASHAGLVYVGNCVICN